MHLVSPEAAIPARRRRTGRPIHCKGENDDALSRQPYRRVTYEEIEAEYRALFRDVQAVACEDDCLRVLQRQYRLGDAMTPIDLCCVRHGMDVNDPFYAQEQAYYDDIGPKISALRNRFGELLVKSPFADCFERLMGAFAFTLIRTRLMGDDSSLIPLQQEEKTRC